MDIGIGAAALADVPLDSGADLAREPSEYSFSDSFGELLNILETGGDQYETSTNLDLSSETSDLSPLLALLDATAPSTVENSLGPTCIPNISSLVSQLRASLCGEFFAHNMNLDRWDPCSSDLLTRQTARVFECIVDNPFTERTTLSTAAAQFYFGKRLSPTADAFHLSTFNPEPQRQIAPGQNVAAVRPKGPLAAAPSLVLLPRVGSLSQAFLKPVGQRTEARKHRNRLSVSRSNKKTRRD